MMHGQKNIKLPSSVSQTHYSIYQLRELLSINKNCGGFWNLTCSPLSTGVLYGSLQRVTVPEAVIIQFVLLKMSIVLLETCWRLYC